MTLKAINIPLFRLIIVLMIIYGNLESLLSKNSLIEVKLQLKWTHQFQFAGFYAAVEKGFFEAEGLDVKLIEGRPGMNYFDEVTSGRADISLEMPNILIERLSGKPLVVLAVIFQHSPEILLTRKDSEINTPHDLIGKKVMLRPEGNLAQRSLFLREGLDKNHLEIIPHTWKVDELVDKKVDALSSYSTDGPFQLREKGVEPGILNPTMYGIDFYGDCIFTSEDYIEHNKDVVDAFLRAVIKGWEYAMKNKQELIDIIIDVYGVKKSRNLLEFEAEAMEQLIQPKFIQFGHMNPGRWEHIAEVYAELGVIGKDYSLEGLLYDPNPPIDYIVIYIIGSSILFLLLVSATGSTILYSFNKKLQQKVKQRTEELVSAKMRAEKSEKLKTEFLAQMSHEIRSPLNTILSFVSLLKEEMSPEADSDNSVTFSSIDSAGQRIIRTIDLLLNMSEIQTGSYHPILVDIDLHKEILSGISQEFKERAREKNLGFEYNRDNFEKIITGDHYSLTQVFINLLDNAIKYTDTGKIELNETVGKDGSLCIEISDTGIGISDDFIDNLFEPFSQEEQGYTRRYEGNGLGLALVKSYCEINNADISVESIKDSGTTFKIKFNPN